MKKENITKYLQYTLLKLEKLLMCTSYRQVEELF